MRFVTSYFNPTLYKKNLSRFWPLWVAWMVLWIFMLPLNLLNTWQNYRGAGLAADYRFLQNCLNLGRNLFSDAALVLSCFYGVLIVMAVYGYLFNHRSAATIHALPMRRENLFVTNFLSGVTFFLLPYAVVFALTALIEVVSLPAELSGLALSCLWRGFWVVTGVSFFYYCFAVFCAQFTGNILALPAFYGILNFLVLLLYSLIMALGDMIFYGGWPIAGEPKWVELLTPAYALSMAVRWNRIDWSMLWDRVNDLPAEGVHTLKMTVENGPRIAAYAAVGVVLAVLALLLYRRRHIETAGDVVSVKVVRPIFRAGVTVCAGLCGGMFTTLFFDWETSKLVLGVYIVLWSAVGFFAAEMLLNKSFRVFRKSWKSALVSTVVMALLVGGFFVDVLGVEDWVPSVNKVEKVRVNLANTYPLDEASYLDLEFTDPQRMDQIVNLHRSIINDYNKYGEYGYGASFAVNYTINGRVYRKSFHRISLREEDLQAVGSTTDLVNRLVNDPEVNEMSYGMDRAKTYQIVSTQLNSVVYPSGRFEDVRLLEGAEEIWAAVQADFAEGNLGERYLFENEERFEQTYRTDLTLYFLRPEADLEQAYYEKYIAAEDAATQEYGEYLWNYTLRVTLTPKARRTIAALEKYSDLGEAYDIALHVVGEDYEK